MDVLANHSIFQELQLVHDTGYFSAMPSLEENWQQVRGIKFFFLKNPTTSHCKPVRVLHFSAAGGGDDVDDDDWAHMRSGCRRQLFFFPTPPEAWIRVGREEKKKKTKQTLFYHSYVTNSRGDGKVEAMGAHAGA